MAYIGFDPRNSNYIKLDSISSGFNGSLATFNLTTNGVPVTAGTPNAVVVSLNGVIQEPTTDYTILGSQIQFFPAPLTGSTCFIISMGTRLDIGVPSDATVTLTKLEGTLSTTITTTASTATTALDNAATANSTANNALATSVLASIGYFQ